MRRGREFWIEAVEDDGSRRFLERCDSLEEANRRLEEFRINAERIERRASDEAAYRERATELLDQIAQQAKQALSDASIDIELFFMVPRSSKAILTFGTLADPPDDLWNRVSEAVSCVVRNSLGIERTRCRGVACASTHTAAASIRQ